MESYRIFVEKRREFNVEARSLKAELNENLQLTLRHLRLLNVYDLFGFTPELLERSRFGVFGEVVTDEVSMECDLQGCRWIAIEYLPGQFDQRAASAEDCVRLIDPTAAVRIKSARLIVLDGDVSDADLRRIRKYCVNPVESRLKDLSRLELSDQAPVRPVEVLSGFRDLGSGAASGAGRCGSGSGVDSGAGRCGSDSSGAASDAGNAELEEYCRKMGLAMSPADLATVVDYFRAEGRDPVETELRILDTYWSDHCRHTTFTTALDDVRIEDSFVSDDMRGTMDLYLKVRGELGRADRRLCLMDLATIGAKYLRSKGLLDDLEVSEENNACSVCVDVEVDGRLEKWLLQFKNETHNHPTEIEPFGGAATCLGGAIRDPLSGRAYVYQAMRLTGAGDIFRSVAQTRPGKLPQRVISRKAAQGYSSYGNQIGLATTCVHEMYHPGYEAKRLEIGAVVGAVKAENVRRESPKPGDAVLLLGGRTGRDGIGGATGSSKSHTEASIETCGSEVQKGNPPEERKLQRLFRRPEVTRLIKKSNDFGAGGVSVAIGELADGLDIRLDRVPTKYSGLNSTELAISESQERMAVVVEACDVERFMAYCAEENVEVTHVADVTGTRRLRMYNGGRLVVDLSRDFIDSAGAEHHARATVAPVEFRNPFCGNSRHSDTQFNKCSSPEWNEVKDVKCGKNGTEFKDGKEGKEEKEWEEGKEWKEMKEGREEIEGKELKEGIEEKERGKIKEGKEGIEVTESKEGMEGMEGMEGRENSTAGRIMEELEEPNHLTQKGLVEMFDSTIGRSTVLMPFGGLLQTTPVQVSVQKLPTDGYTDTASVMAWGCDPRLGEWSPYHAAAYAVVDACTKVVCAGGEWSRMRFSFQEYFERMTADPHSWGRPLAALLGALKMQLALGLPAIGGKDSMSGTFEDLNVPPTFAAFGVTTVDAKDVISPELKWEGDRLYLIRHTPLENMMPDTERLRANWDFVRSRIAAGDIVAACAVGQDSVAGCLCKMAFGNALGVDVKAPEDLLLNSCYGSIVVECETELQFENAVLLGTVTDGEDGCLHFNGEKLDVFELMERDEQRFGAVYPAFCKPSHSKLEPRGMENVKPLKVKRSELRFKGEPVQTPVVYIPVFPGTNCDYDTAKAFRRAGAEVRLRTFRNLTQEDIFSSIRQMREDISNCHILALAGGFSAGDEPDGSGKFIANILNNAEIAAEIERLLERGGLILGICNGFQALVKSGLLPYGRLGGVTKDSPTLFRNDINRHTSCVVNTTVASTNSPWLAGFTIGQQHTVAVSHGEGRFVVSETMARELFAGGQVAFRYSDPIDEVPTMDSPYNPNGSCYAIEGIIDRSGRILGKMGHSERWEPNLFKNIVDDGLDQPLFENAVRYFRGQ